MAERSQIRKPAPKKQAPGAEATTGPTEQAGEIKAELDDLLDEIDEVLEANAEDFVKSYIQKGGE